MPHCCRTGWAPPSSALSPVVDPALAARLPFGLLLALVLVAHLVRRLPPGPHRGRAAVAFAFGGEADPVDYARAIADARCWR
jgi:hypothetical protein